jgi:hypothetical protein
VAGRRGGGGGGDNYSGLSQVGIIIRGKRARGLSRFRSTILPGVVGRTTVKRQVAGSILVSDDFSICILLSRIRGLCGTRGGIPGKEGEKLGRNPRKVTQMETNPLPLPTCQSKQPNLAANGLKTYLIFLKSAME